MLNKGRKYDFPRVPMVVRAALRIGVKIA